MKTKRAREFASLLIAMAWTCTSAHAASQAEELIEQGRYLQASILLKQELATAKPGEPAATQALNLVDRIYEKTNDAAIPVDYVLPESLAGLKIRFLRRFRRPDDEPGGIPGDHRVTLAIEASFDLKSRVRSLTLTQASTKKVILDARNPKQWGGDFEAADRYLGADLDDLADSDSASGLYLLDAVLSDSAGTRVSAWFIVTRALAQGDPEILSPANVPNFIDPKDAPTESNNLEFRFRDFTSALFRPYEGRTLLAYLNFHSNFPNPHAGITLYWKTEVQQPSLELLKPGLNGMPLLKAGEYRFAVDYQEQRGFGPFVLSRESETVIRFFVRK